MAEDIKKIAKLLGSKVEPAPRVEGSTFGLARLAEILTGRLEPSRGKRPGRPSDQSWIRRPKVPMSEDTIRKLTQIAEGVSGPTRKVSPMQVAAQVLEEAVDRYHNLETTSSGSNADSSSVDVLPAEAVSARDDSPASSRHTKCRPSVGTSTSVIRFPNKQDRWLQDLAAPLHMRPAIFFYEGARPAEDTFIHELGLECQVKPSVISHRDFGGFRYSTCIVPAHKWKDVDHFSRKNGAQLLESYSGLKQEFVRWRGESQAGITIQNLDDILGSGIPLIRLQFNLEDVSKPGVFELTKDTGCSFMLINALIYVHGFCDVAVLRGGSFVVDPKELERICQKAEQRNYGIQRWAILQSEEDFWERGLFPEILSRKVTELATRSREAFEVYKFDPPTRELLAKKWKREVISSIGWCPPEDRCQTLKCTSDENQSFLRIISDVA